MRYVLVIIAFLIPSVCHSAFYEVQCGNDPVADTLSISDAISKARANPGAINIHGICHVTSQVLTVNKPGITVRGDGPEATVLNLSYSGNGIVFGANPPFGGCGGIQDLTIDAYPGRLGGFAIVVDGCDKLNINNVHLGRRTTFDPLNQVLGHGIGICINTGNGGVQCNRTFMSHVIMEIHGPNAGVFIANGNDHHISDLNIRCPERQPGSRGILLKQDLGSWISNSDIVFCDVGVSMEPDSGQTVFAVSFNTVHTDSGLSFGWLFGGTGLIRGISCVNCWAGGFGMPLDGGTPSLQSSSRGVVINNADGVDFSLLRVWDTAGTGVVINPGAKNIKMDLGWMSANSSSMYGTYPGLRINTTGGVSITNLSSGTYAYAGVTQSCGIEISPTSDNFTIAFSDLRGNITGLCNNAGVNGISKIVTGVRQ